MKKLMFAAVVVAAAVSFAEVREATFKDGEIPAENPRYTTDAKGRVTRIEVFSDFTKIADGSAIGYMEDTAADLDDAAAAEWVKESNKRLGDAKARYDRKIKDDETDAEKVRKVRKDSEKAEKKDQKNFEKWLKDTKKAMEKSSADMIPFYEDILFFATNREVKVDTAK